MREGAIPGASVTGKRRGVTGCGNKTRNAARETLGVAEAQSLRIAPMAMTKGQVKHVLYAARGHMTLAKMQFGEPANPTAHAALDIALIVSAAFEAGASAERLGTYFRGTTRLDALVSGAAEYLAEPAACEPIAVMGSPIFYACRGPCCSARPRALA